MTYRVVLDGATNRAIAALDADVGWLRITYEIADAVSDDGTTTVTVWQIGTVA